MSDQRETQSPEQYATQEYNLLVADLFQMVKLEHIESSAGQSVIGYFPSRFKAYAEGVKRDLDTRQRQFADAMQQANIATRLYGEEMMRREREAAENCQKVSTLESSIDRLEVQLDGARQSNETNQRAYIGHCQKLDEELVQANAEIGSLKEAAEYVQKTVRLYKDSLIDHWRLLAEERAITEWLEKHWGKDLFVLVPTDGKGQVYDRWPLVGRELGLRAAVKVAIAEEEKTEQVAAANPAPEVQPGEQYFDDAVRKCAEAMCSGCRRALPRCDRNLQEDGGFGCKAWELRRAFPRAFAQPPAAAKTPEPKE